MRKHTFNGGGFRPHTFLSKTRFRERKAVDNLNESGERKPQTSRAKIDRTLPMEPEPLFQPRFVSVDTVKGDVDPTGDNGESPVIAIEREILIYGSDTLSGGEGSYSASQSTGENKGSDYLGGGE
ncbi:MAG: hypothetical protein ABIH37_03250 [archaeon]